MNCIFFMFLTHMSNFIPIGCYLPMLLIPFLCYLIYTIQFINLFFIHHLRLQNLKFKYLINNIVINLWSSAKFVNMENIKRKYNLMVDLLKFTSNKILNRVVILNYNQVCCQTLSSFIYLLLGNHQKNEGNQIWY